jgi:DNA-binding beta-propeller fold protein YncE
MYRGRLLNPVLGVVVAAVFTLSGGSARAQSSYAPVNSGDVPNPYQTMVEWGTLPEGRKWGATAGIAVAPNGNLWNVERCGANSCVGSDVDPIIEIDQRTGQVLRHFGKGMFVQPHGLYVDKHGDVWVTDGQGKDDKGHQVFKFSADGKLLMTLGKAGVAGAGLDEFEAPNSVVVAPNGDIFVGQGHYPADSNSRIMKFDQHGKLLKVIGNRGSGPGEFIEPHGLAMDSKGRLFVADRSNNRIQILDQNGKFITEWKQFGRPSGLFIQDDILYVSDSESRDSNPGGHGYNPGCERGFRIGSVKDGKVTAFIPNPDGLTGGSEGIAVDHDGNVYGAARISMEAGRLEKFVPIKKH